MEGRIAEARSKLDAHTCEIVAWHFDLKTGCPFWLEYAKKLGWGPRKEIQGYDDLDKFPFFEDEWLRGGPVRRWVPKAYADRPIYIFETGGSTGVPKSRINIDDFRIDYEMFSETLPDAFFPKGADWLHVGPSGPRRLRLSILAGLTRYDREAYRLRASRLTPGKERLYAQCSCSMSG